MIFNWIVQKKKTIHLGDPPSMEPPMCMTISCRKRHITKSCQTWQPEKIDLCVKEFEEIPVRKLHLVTKRIHDVST